MKTRIYCKWIALLMVWMSAAAAFVACEQEEEDYVSLEAFGPTPLKRGETVRFIGSNLNRVTAVVFPENIEVAPTVVSSGEITAVIPAAAANGYITLRYPGGSITSKSRIAYADAVAFDSIYGAASPVRAGDTITVTGDNLTGVSQVVFSVEVAVESRDFLTQSRHEITLALPANAQTGDVYLLAGAEETSHRTLSVDGPSITALAPTQPKPGRDTLEITGANLDLAVSVIFAGDVTVDAVPVSATQVKAAVPANAQNGAIKVVSAAGLEYESPDALTLLAPSNLILTAGPYKVGSNITISGHDLDLVTGVTFTDGVSAENFSYDEATGITVAIPATATDGAITLLRVAGNGVPTSDITLVKPAITNITPASIQAGEKIAITGADLDLVTGVTVGGKACTIDAQTETEIQAATPMDAAIAGAGVEVALTLANGVSVTGAIDVTFPLYCFILELPAPDVEIKAGELLKVIVENSSMLTGVEINGSPVQHILQSNTLYVAIPGNAGGSASLKLISSNGNATYTISVIATGPVETVVFQGPVELTWSDGGRAVVPASAFENVAAGTVMKIYFTQTDNWGQAQINNGQWGTFSFAELGNDGYIKTDTDNDKSVSEQELELTQDILDNIAANVGTGAFDGAGVIIQGQDWIIAKITLVTAAGGGSETLWEGIQATGSWSGNVTLEASAFAGAKAGNKIVVTCADVTDGAQWGIRDGSWSNIVDYADIVGSSYEYTIDAAGLAALQATGGIFTGHDYTITKIEIKK
ncbi:MAG: IPT/TIG domain-containing protein [Prevotellaceae bacterium]|jgi:hypothetical protein|nr:IPT/TIG domain-containing protein [Prevotellaceae bacterium]